MNGVLDWLTFSISPLSSFRFPDVDSYKGTQISFADVRGLELQ
jgi:hypothetical protein